MSLRRDPLCGGCTAQGAASLPLHRLPAEHFKILRGTPKRFAKQADSGRALLRYFCGECGSSLYSHRETMPEVIGVRAGTLDDASGLRITAHIWTNSAPPWSYIDPAATHYPVQPETPPRV
ncbi:MAG TPA: GFA family protein [Burkholderiales bacterium]|nr:GFA family protein [Burkholderiales bacterium]